MNVLVTYSSKHGATRQIAERIAGALRTAGLAVDVQAVKDVEHLESYDAVVLGSSVYMGAWNAGARAFARRHRAELAARPVWLFSSGPLGADKIDAEGHDVRENATPKDIAEFSDSIKPREHQVFFGALDHEKFGLAERLLWMLPASKELMPEGDFRDWDTIDAWSAGIAHDLAPAATG